MFSRHPYLHSNTILLWLESLRTVKVECGTTKNQKNRSAEDDSADFFIPTATMIKIEYFQTT